MNSRRIGYLVGLVGLGTLLAVLLYQAGGSGRKEVGPTAWAAIVWFSLTWVTFGFGVAGWLPRRPLVWAALVSWCAQLTWLSYLAIAVWRTDQIAAQTALGFSFAVMVAGYLCFRQLRAI